ncbi:MAG: HAMP domain-containing sensor histidine kinase [Patescibacteria group bacterium]
MASKKTVIEEIKDNFLLVASHQLKLPLNTMRLNLEMVLNGDLGKINRKVRANITEALKVNTKCLELVSDFLNASALEKESSGPKEKPFDLLATIKDVIKETEILARQHRVKIKFLVTPKKAKHFMASAKYFSEVVKNLLSNAIKYNRDGGTVEISLKKSAGKASLSIQDSGIGIPLKDQKKLFGKFFRADNAMRSATEGSGLGLFIVKSYVEKWGGKIFFKSTEGQGTTFFIEIPL